MSGYIFRILRKILCLMFNGPPYHRWKIWFARLSQNTHILLFKFLPKENLVSNFHASNAFSKAASLPPPPASNPHRHNHQPPSPFLTFPPLHVFLWSIITPSSHSLLLVSPPTSFIFSLSFPFKSFLPLDWPWLFASLYDLLNLQLLFHKRTK